MFNNLCNACTKKCKQSDSVKIVSCPSFIKNPSEKEFRKMVDDLDFAEEKAKRVQKRVKSIIKAAIKGNSSATESDKNNQDSPEEEEKES
jgi:hypothetical protein